MRSATRRRRPVTNSTPAAGRLRGGRRRTSSAYRSRTGRARGSLCPGGRRERVRLRAPGSGERLTPLRRKDQFRPWRPTTQLRSCRRCRRRFRRRLRGWRRRCGGGCGWRWWWRRRGGGPRRLLPVRRLRDEGRRAQRERRHGDSNQHPQRAVHRYSLRRSPSRPYHTLQSGNPDAAPSNIGNTLDQHQLRITPAGSVALTPSSPTDDPRSLTGHLDGRRGRSERQRIDERPESTG